MELIVIYSGQRIPGKQTIHTSRIVNYRTILLENFFVNREKTSLLGQVYAVFILYY